MLSKALDLNTLIFCLLVPDHTPITASDAVGPAGHRASASEFLYRDFDRDRAYVEAGRGIDTIMAPMDFSLRVSKTPPTSM